MEDEPREECQIRRRRASRDEQGLNLPLNLEVGYRVADGGTQRGTPSPCTVKFIPSTRGTPTGASTSLTEFRKKQQSFEIQIEDCDEEEIVIESEGEGEGDEEPTPAADRPVTPTPLQDFSGNVTYTEGPQPMEYLQVRAGDQDCLTDVSDAESEGNDA